MTNPLAAIALMETIRMVNERLAMIYVKTGKLYQVSASRWRDGNLEIELKEKEKQKKQEE